jgi:hypothetical protein
MEKIPTKKIEMLYDGSEPSKILELYKGYKNIYWLFVKESLWDKESSVIEESFQISIKNHKEFFKKNKKRKPKSKYAICIVSKSWKRGSDFYLYDAAYDIESKDLVIVEKTSIPISKNNSYSFVSKKENPEYKIILVCKNESVDRKRDLITDQLKSFYFNCILNYEEPGIVWKNPAKL